MRWESTKVKPLGGAAKPYPDHRDKNDHERNAEHLFNQSRQQHGIAEFHTNNVKYGNKGFFARHMELHKAKKATRQANKFSKQALKQWNKGDKLRAKSGRPDVPSEPAPFSSHRESPPDKWNGINRGDWTHDDYH